MSLKFVLAIGFLCCLFLEPSNAQTQYDQLKSRDRFKPIVPLPTLRPQNQPPNNQQNNEQNGHDGKNPVVPLPTLRPQNQPPNNQQNNHQNGRDRPLGPLPTQRPHNLPQCNPFHYVTRQQRQIWLDINSRLQTISSQIQQEYYQHINFINDLKNLHIRPNIRI